MHVLIDSNVPLNIYLFRITKRPMPVLSGKVMAAAVRGQITAYMTPTAFSNTYYFLQKYLAPAAANHRAEDLLDVVRIVGQDEDVFRKALNSGWSDVEDAGQYFAALRVPRITHLCTMNSKDFARATGVKAVSPKDLLSLL